MRVDNHLAPNPGETRRLNQTEPDVLEPTDCGEKLTGATSMHFFQTTVALDWGAFAYAETLLSWAPLALIGGVAI
jgi:hypothetical protein